MSRQPLAPSRRAPRRSSNGARALLAFLAAVALLCSQGFSVLHFVLVPHHLCQVHGTLEDGAATAHQAESGNSHEHAATQAADSSGDHEACAVAAVSKHGALLPQALPHAVEIGGNVVAVQSGRPGVKPDRAAILARAPKLSPPRVA